MICKLLTRWSKNCYKLTRTTNNQREIKRQNKFRMENNLKSPLEIRDLKLKYRKATNLWPRISSLSWQNLNQLRKEKEYRGKLNPATNKTFRKIIVSKKKLKKYRKTVRSKTNCCLHKDWLKRKASNRILRNPHFNFRIYQR